MVNCQLVNCRILACRTSGWGCLDRIRHGRCARSLLTVRSQHQTPHTLSPCGDRRVPQRPETQGRTCFVPIDRPPRPLPGCGCIVSRALILRRASRKCSEAAGLSPPEKGFSHSWPRFPFTGPAADARGHRPSARGSAGRAGRTAGSSSASRGARRFRSRRPRPPVFRLQSALWPA